MAWTEPNTIASDLRSRLRRLFPAFSWEIARIDGLAEVVEMRGVFCLNGQRCGIYLYCNHEIFHETSAADDRIKHYVARAVTLTILDS